MRIWDLRQKEVINVCDCKRLGCVVDIEFDECKGCINAIIIPGPAKICGFFGRDTEYIIPWNCIKQIGPDVILVQVDEEKVLVKCKY